MKTLYELRAYLESIPYINNGGCAIAALFMYKWLKTTRPKSKVQIAYLYSSGHKKLL